MIVPLHTDAVYGYAYHSYFTKSIPLPLKIQITIHPLSTDGAIVIYLVVTDRNSRIYCIFIRRSIYILEYNRFNFKRVSNTKAHKSTKTPPQTLSLDVHVYSN